VKAIAAFRKECQSMVVRKKPSGKKSPKNRQEAIRKLVMNMRKDLLAEISARLESEFIPRILTTCGLGRRSESD
jgi:hypothetical protein